MKSSSIRFATWMCALTLGGCSLDGSANRGVGGGVEELTDPSAASTDPWAEPVDPWAEPAEPADPWTEAVDAMPEQPENPWAEPADAAPEQPADPWSEPAAPAEPAEPWAEPSDSTPADPWAEPADPWTEPEDAVPEEPPAPANPAVDAAEAAGGAVVPETYECPRGAPDFDDDGLCDAAEATHGTETDNPDTDGDALSDGIEVFGIAFEGRTLDMAALGADPLRRDVFLEIDYVSGYQPHPQAIERVVAAFETAGIALHAEVGQQVSVGADIPVLSVEQVDAEFKQPNLDRLRAFVFRWVLFAHSYNGGGSSGVAPYANSWLLVTLGKFTFDSAEEQIQAQAGTLMHELGHTFDLRHGGIADETNFKPNHLSVMNYHYQFIGVRRDGVDVLDYASIAVDAVSESSLSESEAFAPGAGTSESDLARYTEPLVCISLDPISDYCYRSERLTGNLSESLDFTRVNGIESGPLAVDLNGNGTNSDYFRPAVEEWSQLRYDAGNVIGNLKPRVRRDISESRDFATCQNVPGAQF